MSNNLNELKVRSCIFNLFLLFLCLCRSNWWVSCHCDSNLLSIVVALKHVVGDNLRVCVWIRKPLEDLLLSLNYFIDISLTIINVFESSIVLGIFCIRNCFILFVVFISWTTGTLAESGAHLFIDTRLELFVKVSNWLEYFSSICIHFIKFSLIGKLAIFCDPFLSTCCWCYQEGTKYK